MSNARRQAGISRWALSIERLGFEVQIYPATSYYVSGWNLYVLRAGEVVAVASWGLIYGATYVGHGRAEVGGKKVAALHSPRGFGVATKGAALGHGYDRACRDEVLSALRTALEADNG